MLILVTYDVNTESEGGKRRLRKVAKICTNYGVRVQNSVFECIVDATKMVELKAELQKTIDVKKDSLRFYNLGKNYDSKVDHIGTKVALRVDKPLIL